MFMKTGFFLFIQLLCFGIQAQQLDTAKLNTFFNLLDKNSEGSGSISIMENGQTIYERGYGFAQIENEKAVNEQTLFRIGSISKTYTATLIIMAVEEGKLSLNNKLSEFYPQFKASDSITIDHLLRHRSGLFNFTESPVFPILMAHNFSKEDLLKFILKGENQFSPGTQKKYSNSGYVLLTFILEDIYQKDYSTILAEKILKPLSLTQTYYQKEIDPSKNEAFSYYKTMNWEKAPVGSMSIPLGAGAITATAHDVNIFINALFNYQLVSKEGLEWMTTMKDNYGYGLFKVPYNDKWLIGHNGSIDAFQSDAYYQEEDKLQLTILYNAVSYPKNDILLAVLNTYYQKNFTLPDFKANVELTAEQIKEYPGIYKSDESPLDITIVRNDNKLTAQATGQSAFPLSAKSESTFEFKPAGIIIVFNKEENSLKLTQAGRTFTLIKD